MRKLQIGDLLSLAGSLAGANEGLARGLRLCDEAHAAHAYCKRFARLHPLWGNGSLMSRLQSHGGTMQAEWGGAGLDALALACLTVRLWRAQRLDCRAARLCGRIYHTHGESATWPKSSPS